MQAIRVLVLDDSAICRARLRDILEASGDIQVVGEAANGDSVLDLIRKTSPRLLVVDLQMPGTGGQATIERVMAHHPLPILVVSGQPEGVRKSAVFEAIRRGALDLAEKPGPMDRAGAERLRTLVRQLSAVPVVRHIAGTLRQNGAAPAPVRAAAPPRPAPLKPSPSPVRSPALALGAARPLRSGMGVVGIVASAGGPLALVALLAELPRDFAAAVAIVQHLPNGFAYAFVEFLQARQALPVVLVKERCALRAGTIYLASDDRHLVAADPQHLTTSSEPAIQNHRPSGDALLQSLATVFGARAAGVILSGIGQDGVVGLSALNARGALTLAQDQASCGVFGMPRAALESGAAASALDPVGIARALRVWSQNGDDGRVRPDDD